MNSLFRALLIVVGALLLLFAAQCAFLAWSLGGVFAPSPEEIAAKRHSARGDELLDAGQLDAAIAEYRLAHADGLYPMMTRQIAKLLQDANRFEEALAEIDREGPAVSWGEYCSLRTECLERWKGSDAAVAWLLEKDAEEPERPFFQDTLGSFHYYGGRPREAIAPLREAIRRGLAAAPFEFDANDALVYVGEEPLATPGIAPDESLPDLWPAQETLCLVFERLGDDANAWKEATREVSYHQWLKRERGYYPEPWPTAGSFTGRMVRARILLRRGDLDGAAKELDYATAVVSNYSKHAEELAAAKAELARRRSGGR
ncbi:MAG: hypothetical protein JNL90_21360 [Planctomycetes bacterium]|nr:hypothetical protein [Planctomycetota bacterium]